jgi:hypothetical protein
MDSGYGYFAVETFPSRSNKATHAVLPPKMLPDIFSLSKPMDIISTALDTGSASAMRAQRPCEKRVESKSKPPNLVTP